MTTKKNNSKLKDFAKEMASSSIPVSYGTSGSFAKFTEIRGKIEHLIQNNTIDYNDFDKCISQINPIGDRNEFLYTIASIGLKTMIDDCIVSSNVEALRNFPKTSIENSILNYRKQGLEILQLDDNTVKITQKKIINGYILNRKELVDRAKEIFPNSKILPVRYSLDVAEINPVWIQEKMKEFGLTANDLVSQIALDKSSLSLFFSGERKMNKSVKALFFYYFLTFELNRDFREYINSQVNDNEEHSLIKYSISNCDLDEQALK
jgi:hypothetical protein